MTEDIDLSLLNEILEAGRDPDEPVPDTTPAAAVEGLDFEIPQHVLAALVRRGNFSIPTRDWKPVLRNFFVMCIPGRMRLISSTGEFTTVLETTMVTVTQPGLALLPAPQLLEIIKVAGSGTLRVRVEEERAVISMDRVSWEIPLHRQARYPDPPLPSQVSFVAVDREKLLGAIESVRFAVSTDETRPRLRMVQIKNGKVTASDGDRFQQAPLDTAVSLSFPAETIVDVVRILSHSTQVDVELGQNEDFISLRDGQDVYWFSKTKDAFADAENFLLKPALYNNRELIVAKTALLEAVRHVRLNSDPKTEAIGLFLTQSQIAVSARSPEGGKATEFIDSVWKGKERVLVVNHNYLAEMLRMHPSESCRFLLGDDTKSKRHPLLLRDDTTGSVGLIQQMHSGRAVYDRLD